MVFTETNLPDAFVIDIEKHEDSRGFYARAWCKHEFEAHGIAAEFIQSNISFSHSKGTLRGLHYQLPPYQEAKLITCISGSIYNVIIDLRPSSPTAGEWFGTELCADNSRALFMPEGFANGFISLLDNTKIFYSVTKEYRPDSERGLRYNDPAFHINWPVPINTISDKDLNWPSYSDDC